MIDEVEDSARDADPDGPKGSSEARHPVPIFVLTPPAMPGATLAAALGQNPDAYALPEINLPLVATVDTFLREMSGPRLMQTHGLLRALGQLYGGEQTAHSVEMARRWLDLRGWMATEAAFADIAARIEPFHMVAPVTAALFQPSAMKRLKTAFAQAQFVVLRAHPRVYGHLALDSEAGRIAMQLSGSVDEAYDPPLPDPQLLWLRTEEAIEVALSDVPKSQVTELRVEDLVREPADTLRKLARKLGLKWNKAALERMQTPETSEFAGPGPLGAHGDGQIHAFEELAEEFPEEDEGTLDGPLDWRPEEAGFNDDVLEKARALGLS